MQIFQVRAFLGKLTSRAELFSQKLELNPSQAEPSLGSGATLLSSSCWILLVHFICSFNKYLRVYTNCSLYQAIICITRKYPLRGYCLAPPGWRQRITLWREKILRAGGISLRYGLGKDRQTWNLK